MAADTGLVVPVDVVAFCVSTRDAQEATASLAGASVVYTQQTAPYLAFLGVNVSRGLAQPAWQKLEAGVHLHWALPDALTRAKVDEQQTAVQFPAAPNRWLVTRFVVSGATATVRSWVIESDALNAAPPTGQSAVTVPVSPTGNQNQNYAYLGQNFDLASYAPTHLLGGPRRLLQATGSELTAVSNGVPSFAAFYPECRSAFGFVDPLTDVSSAANLMYVVTGWYDAVHNDPAQRTQNLKAAHKWAAAADAQPAYTLYSGLVQDVAWDPARDYVLNQPNLQPITASCAIGNTPTEALSAYLNTKHVQLFEQLLNGFQLGLLKSFATPKPDQLAQLAEALHSNQFQAADAGVIYTVATKVADGSETEVIDLPLPLADALNQLNVYQQQLEEVQSHVTSFQWQMFADWSRYFQANSALTAAVFNHSSSLYGQWSDLQSALTQATTQAQTQLATVDAMLGRGLYLKPVPAPRYWQPTEPAVLLASPDLGFPVRYGGDNSYSGDGTLKCRTTDELVTQVAVAGTNIAAGQFAAITTLPSTNLPYAATCSGLLAEACLLNSALAAALSGQTDATLATALEELLAGQSQALWTITTGVAPSPVALTWWGLANPWLPLFLTWTVNYAPLQPTQQNGQLVSYDPLFFTTNYKIDPDTGSFILYNGVNIDPAAATYGSTYTGQAILSAAAARNLAGNLTDYLDKQPDPTLQAALDQLESMPTPVQPLSGFTQSLLMRQQIVQLNVAVPSGAPYQAHYITGNTANVVGQYFHIGPQFSGSAYPYGAYNPIRAGYFTVSLKAVDAFGQRRDIILDPLVTAESMTAVVNQVTSAGIGYAAPRLAQPARLLFEWLSASAAGLMEMNAHPATTPVCGWLLPNHLNGGFFLYDAAGRPLGTLQLNGDQTEVAWQSAPGDDATINMPIEQALADVNPVLYALAVSLQQATPAFFLAFWRAVDQVHGSINPQQLAANVGLSVLVGRPVAVAQVMLRLDLDGRPLLNQSWACLSPTQWVDTENGFSAVQYPVVLGDIDKLDDGLIGYFRQSGNGYDLTTFFTEGADSQSTSGVVQPTQTTLLLTPTPTLGDPEPPPVASETTRVLLLVDPRAKVHATTGILPMQYVQIPPDVAADALSTLEMSFLNAPVLQPAGGLAIPVPSESGYAVSWVEEDKDGNDNPAWITIPDIAAPKAGAVWDYTPQRLTEGWLRLNPTLISFDLLNASGQGLVTGGTAQSVTLRVANRKPATVTFNPGKLQPEGQPPKGSLFYVHFGALVAQSDVPTISFTAPGWTFAAQNDQRYGQYWAATPSSDAVALAPGQSFDISVANLKAVTDAVQAQVYFDYYGVDGASDGLFADLVTIKQQSQ